jgi:hypothetical protein
MAVAIFLVAWSIRSQHNRNGLLFLYNDNGHDFTLKKNISGLCDYIKELQMCPCSKTIIIAIPYLLNSFTPPLQVGSLEGVQMGLVGVHVGR